MAGEETLMTDHVDPTREQFNAFKDLPRDTPIHMLNLIRYREVADYGIKVSLIRPGFVRTDFGDQEQASLAKHRLPDYAEHHDTFAKWHHENGHKVAPDAVCVAEAAEKALTAPNPRTRYAVPRSAIQNIGLRSFLPAPLVDTVLNRIIRKS